MDEYTFALLIMIFMGALPCMLLGYLIGIKQKRHLISGLDESKVSNPEAYAKLLGYGLFFLGFLITIISIVWYTGLIDEIGMTLAILVASCSLIPFIVIANRKYKSRIG